MLAESGSGWWWLNGGRCCDLLEPGGHYRITSNIYPVGADFGGSLQPVTFYVLSGHCELTGDGAGISLVAGDVLEWPGGDFMIKVTGDQQLHVVSIWLLPVDFRK